MRDGERWIFLFVLGLLVFNWPFLTIFEDSHPVALFACWGIFIAVVAVFSLTRKKGRNR
jgi:hypothetical protein